MATVYASAVAVAGTLLGLVVSHTLQRRTSREAEQRARSEQRRSEQVDASSGLAETILHLRRAEYNRWWQRDDGDDGRAPIEVRDEAYRLRAAAWHAYFRLKLLCDDAEVMERATIAIEAAADIHEAEDEADVRSRGEEARRTLDAFIMVAGEHLR